MMNFKILLIYILLFFVLVLFGVFIKSLLKKESAKYLSFELSGCIAFIVLFCVLAIPGSESNFKMGPIRYKIKTPSEASKLIGHKEKTFEAQNTDKTNPKSLIVSASSTSQTIGPDLKFLIGKEYIKTIYESKDGRERIFIATLPPGKELKTATPDQVVFNVLPASPSDNKEKNEIMRELYGLGINK